MKFEFKTGIGKMTLLGGLMVIVGPLFLITYLADGSPDTHFYGRTISLGPNWTIPWVTCAIALLGGIPMVVSGLRPANRRGSITLGDESLFLADPRAGLQHKEILYSKVRDLVIEGEGRTKQLRFNYSQGPFVLQATAMKSPQDFDELCTQLTARSDVGGIVD